MQSLGGKRRHKEMDLNRIADAMPDNSARGDAAPRQLPRLVRRFIRYTGGLTVMRFATSRVPQVILAGAAIVIGSGYFIQNADKNSLIASMSSHAGFEASKLIVNGNVNLDINVLQARLASQLGNSLFSFKVDAAREEVLSDPWVKSVVVKKAYPDTIIVDVVERKPVALWQSKGEVFLIARDGFVIDKASPKHMNLPQVVGEGANKAASEFLSIITRFPDIAKNASAYVRVAGRRWNVRFSDGPQVLLPEFDWQYALNDLQDLQQKKDILNRDILQVDMRLPDRLVLKLDPEVAEIRKTAIEKSLKRKWHKT